MVYLDQWQRNPINKSYAYTVSNKTVAPPTSFAIVDSGAMDHYITKAHSSTCSQQTATPTGPNVLAADGKIMKATHSL